MKRALNKKNMKKFADSIFHTKDGWHHYTKLCKGTLKNNGMCCAVGEMKEFFLSKIDESDYTRRVVNQLCHVSGRNSNDVDFYDDNNLLNALINLTNVNDNANNYYDRARRCHYHIINYIIPLLP